VVTGELWKLGDWVSCGSCCGWRWRPRVGKGILEMFSRGGDAAVAVVVVVVIIVVGLVMDVMAVVVGYIVVVGLLWSSRR